MPPGQAKRWTIGRPLPRDVVYYNLPPSIVELHETIAGEELLPRKSLHKSSKIKSGGFCTVKPNFNSANPSIHKGLRIMETIEWE
mgnify:FL=1